MQKRASVRGLPACRCRSWVLCAGDGRPGASGVMVVIVTGGRVATVICNGPGIVVRPGKATLRIVPFARRKPTTDVLAVRRQYRARRVAHSCWASLAIRPAFLIFR